MQKARPRDLTAAARRLAGLRSHGAREAGPPDSHRAREAGPDLGYLRSAPRLVRRAVAVGGRVSRTRTPACVAVAALLAGIPAAVRIPGVAGRTGLPGRVRVSVPLAVRRGARMKRLPGRLLLVQVGRAATVAVCRYRPVGRARDRAARRRGTRPGPIRRERASPALLGLPPGPVRVHGAARRLGGTAVNGSFGPQRVRRAGQRILLRAGSGGRRHGGGLVSGSDRTGRAGRWRHGRHGRLCRRPVIRAETGLRMRSRAVACHSAGGLAARVTGLQVRDRPAPACSRDPALQAAGWHPAAASWPRCPAGRCGRSWPTACRPPGHPRTARRKLRRTPRPATVPHRRRFPYARPRAAATGPSCPRYPDRPGASPAPPSAVSPPPPAHRPGDRRAEPGAP